MLNPSLLLGTRIESANKQTKSYLSLASLIYFLRARANKERQLGKFSGAFLRDA